MLQQIILGLLLVFFVACSSQSEQEDIAELPAIEESDEILTEEDLLIGDEPMPEDSLLAEEESLSAQEDAFAEEEYSNLDETTSETGFGDEAFDTQDSFAEFSDTTSTENQMDTFAQEAPEPEISQGFTNESESFFNESTDLSNSDTAVGSVTSGQPANVTKLDFLANQNGGTIVITTDNPVAYTTRANPENKQFIVEIPNTKLPQKFQRPFNTNEFKGAIGMFQGYQNPDGNVARFVVQMDQDGEPMVQQEGNTIMIIASGAAPTDNFVESPAPMVEESYQEPVAEAPVVNDAEVLEGRSIEDLVTGNTTFYGRRINIEVKDWDIRDVFDFIAEQSGLNIVLAEEVQGKISLKLREVPWDQALFVVMQSKQLGYKRQGNIVRIAPLASLRAETDAAKQVLDSQRLLQPTQVKIIPVSYAKAKDLEAQVRDFLTPNRGKVKADERTNSMVVTDIPEVIEKVSQLVKSLDTQTPQVLIEAKIVEAKETLRRQVGIDWTAGGTNDNVQVKTAFESFAGKISFGKVGSDFMGALSLLEAEDVLRVLSSPRIMGLNNETSKIEQTSDIPIKKSDNINGTITETTTYIPVSLILEVTPQITSQGSVIMGLKLTREFVGEQDDDGRPIFKRKANTTVVVNNGETAVVGGIYQSDQLSKDNGVPFFSKIPLLGYLFKSESRQHDKNELMMFVTPRIMNLDKAFATDTSEEDIIEEQSDFL